MDGFADFAGLADGAAVYGAAWAAGLAPERDLRVSEWAEEHRRLSTKTSSEPGPWRNERTPYLVEIMDCLSTGHPAEEVVVCTGTQIGKTECGNNWIGYVIDQAPAPMIAVQPTLALGKRFSHQRLASMFDATPVLKGRVGDKRSRDAANTTLMKEFDGGMLVIAGANSAAALRQMPCKYIFADEVDAYPFDVDGEGDPLSLVSKRATNFPRRKKLITSSPTTRGFSRIDDALNRSDRRRYHVPCPHCGALQVLKWAQMRWSNEPHARPETAHYVCEHNGCVIDEHHKTAMMATGGGARWIPDFPGRGGGRVVGFHLPTLYSPLGWESWQSLVEQFLEAKRALDAGDDTKMKTFVNTCLAETWEEAGDRVGVEALQQRADTYPLRSVPLGGLALAMSVDVQGNRLEYKIKAYGRFEESWLVDYGVLWGDPGEHVGGAETVWAELRRVITTPLAHANGRELRVRACAIDSGGHHTHAVYEFCRLNKHLRVFAVKGASQAAKPVLGLPSVQEINYRGEKIKRGVQLWPIGTDTAKALVYGRLRLSDPGPGFMHFPRELPGDYYVQLTAERLATRYVKGRPRLEWIKPAGARNEALDLEVYVYAAACFLGLNRYTVKDWDVLERQVQPAQQDLLDVPAVAPGGGLPDKPGATAAVAESAETGAIAARASAVAVGAGPARRRGRAARRPGFVNRW
jgi:phage terminase large subunit GpA-like protein